MLHYEDRGLEVYHIRALYYDYTDCIVEHAFDWRDLQYAYDSK